MKKKFLIKTLGCKVNQYESQAIREDLVKAGLEECGRQETPDVFIVNTCTVTGEADKESRYSIGLFHRMNPDAKIIVTGCYAEKNGAEIMALSGVSHVLKNGEKNKISALLTDSSVLPRPLKISDFKGHTKAFVKIQDGCENFCAYCKVPFVRGGLVSKAVGDIVEEVRILSSRGFKEIILTGICLGSWGKEISRIAESSGYPGDSNIGLPNVLRAIDKIPGDFRIRLSSIEPKYVTDELLGFMAGNKRICKHLHIPLQSGDDYILKRMNRPYSSDEYRGIIEKAKKAIDGLSITTDVLVGFPGESEKNFENTLELIKDIGPLKTHIFPFSPREGTAAYKMDGVVPKEVAKKRCARLNTIALGASYLFRENFVGTMLDVLVEGARDRSGGMLTGYSGNYIKVVFDGPDEIARKIVPVKMEYITLGETVGIYDSKS